ncbi:MAG: leucine-rich repeat protein [Muribaculaceae bacterium]|nr:leucine-rich repeat protein [Muribaculaceae bacterium]
MKQILKATLLLLLGILLPSTAAAYDFEVDGIYYNINGNEAEVTIGPNGFKYTGDVTIPATVIYGGTSYSVTSIGNSAFYHCSGLTSISIHNSITSIGDDAFGNCTMLTSIDIPNSVTSIGGWAFYGCSGLTSIDIPNSVISIGEDAFHGTTWYNNQPVGLVYAGLVAYKYKGTMPNGTSITIREGTLSISGGAFSGCSGLISIDIPNSVTSIGDWAFYNCNELTDVTIGNSVTSIGNCAFLNCFGLSSISIPNSVTTIGERAFSGTAWLDNQPDGLIYAGLIAYQYKGTMPNGTSITIREGTLGITENAFSYCSGLASITIPNTVSSIGSFAFIGCNSLISICIPSSVTIINEGTFEECSSLISVTISNSVTYIGENAFGFCNALTNVNIPDALITIEDFAFWGCAMTNIQIPSSVTHIGYGAFGECTRLTNIVVADGNLKYDSRLNCNAIIETATNKLICGCKNTTIPNTITSIGEMAFVECMGLSSITIPNSVTSIENGAFSGCSCLSSIFIIGEGEWVAGYLPDNISTLCIDEGITGVNGMKVKPQDVFCFATTPPTCDENSFTDYSGTLHVPATSLAAYFTAPYWCNFNLVGDAVKADSIKVNCDSINMLLGEETTLIANIFPVNATSNVITWASSNPEVANVVDGEVTAMAAGECEIYAMCLDHKATCHITVYSDRISLYPQEAQVLPNHILTLTPTSLAAQLPELAVTSSDATVAAARMLNGKVQVVGIKEGTATITVNAADGTAQPATCLVTVYTERGDINCDGYVSIADVTTLIDYLLSGDEESINKSNADVNQDGRISIGDVTSLIDLLLSGGS